MEIWTSAPEKKKRDQELSKKKGAPSRGKKNMGAAKKLCGWLLWSTLHILIVFNTFTFEVLWRIISKIYRHRKTTAICLTAIVSDLCCCRLFCWYDKVVRSSGYFILFSNFDHEILQFKIRLCFCIFYPQNNYVPRIIAILLINFIF